jgi:hypothetical protein
MTGFNNLFSTLLRPLFTYIVVIITATASFFIGRYYDKLTREPIVEKTEMVRIDKSDVTLAINEQNELMMINKNNGSYTVYSDSIGKSIFALYTKNLWGQHAPATK